MNNSTSVKTQAVIIGEGSIRRMEEMFERFNARKIFFVVDEPAYKVSGAAKIVDRFFQEMKVTWFSDFEMNPKIEDVDRGVKLFRRNPPDLVIGLGGGSAIDMAKLIAGCGSGTAKPETYITGAKTVAHPLPPVIAVPTTSGTGSEATHFAVVYIDGEKFSFAHSRLLPDVALIDPRLTWSLPSRTTAACGLDALCQCMESIWAVGADEISINYAAEGLKLALHYLEPAVNNPAPESRQAMARSAHFSGKAINRSKTTAPHALSYGMTSRYNVPHGMAVALTVGEFLAYNYLVTETDCIDPRGMHSVKTRMDTILKLMNSRSAEHARKKISSLLKNINCPLRLRDAGIRMKDLESIRSDVNIERLSNNPRKIDKYQLKILLEHVY
jgi:alcohol dehydrogenase